MTNCRFFLTDKTVSWIKIALIQNNSKNNLSQQRALLAQKLTLWNDFIQRIFNNRRRARAPELWN